MQLIKSEEILGNSKVLVGDLQSDMVLQTLGKIYIRSGKNLKLLTDIAEGIANSDAKVIIVNSTMQLELLEYPGDGRFVYNTGNSILYLTYKDRYIALIEVTGVTGNYVKKTGDTMTGTLEVATTKVPFIVHSRKLVENLNAEYLNGEKADSFARRTAAEKITGKWQFLSECVSNEKWQFLKDINIKGDFISSGSLQSPVFSSGFSGSGWRLDGSTNTLTIDNLVVRKLMQVYELVINKISATNGSIWVSNSSKIDSVYPVSTEVSKYFIYKKDTTDVLVFVQDLETFRTLVRESNLDSVMSNIISEESRAATIYDYNSELNKNIYFIEYDPKNTTEQKTVYPYKEYFKDGNLYVINTDQDEYSTLKTGDIVRCQKFQDNSIKYYDALVYYLIDTNKYLIQKAPSILDVYTYIEYDEEGNIVEVIVKQNEGLYNKTRVGDQSNPKSDYYQDKLANPFEGDDLVQMGNIQDPERQGAIYITATDDCGPYIEVLDGINRPNYSQLKLIPVYTTYLYKNKKYYVSTTSNLQGYQGVGLGHFFIDENNKVTRIPLKENEEAPAGSEQLYGYKIPLDGCLVLKENGQNKIAYQNPTKVRLGNLEGIYNYLLGNKQPHGYGLYGENVFLTGEFYLNNGQSVVDFSQDQLMLKYGEAGIKLYFDTVANEYKIQLDTDKLELNLSAESEGPSSKVLFSDGTMKFYHKVPSIPVGAQEPYEDRILQEGDNIWIKAIYLGYGIPNADSSGEVIQLEPEPLLVFCDQFGEDLYNLGPSGLFKSQIKSPAVIKKTVYGIKLNGDYNLTPDSTGVITINGLFQDINYFYITEGNNEIQKRFAITIQYEDIVEENGEPKPVYTYKVKTIKMIANSLCFESVCGVSANEDPPALVFDSNLSAKALPSLVKCRTESFTVLNTWFATKVAGDGWWQTGYMPLYEHQVFTIKVIAPQADEGTFEGIYFGKNTTDYPKFWQFIDSKPKTGNAVVDLAIAILRNIFTRPIGLTAYSVTTLGSYLNSGEVYSPLYYYTEGETNDVAWELAYIIYKELVSDPYVGEHPIGSISDTMLVTSDNTMKTHPLPEKSPTQVDNNNENIIVHNLYYETTLTKYFVDNDITNKGTIVTKDKIGSNILDISLNITESEVTIQVENSGKQQYLFYK